MQQDGMEQSMPESKTERKLSGVALIAALIVLAAWLVLLSWLAFHTGATEVQWARLGSVLGSLEAVAFAAAGALFGTTIQKQRVQEARERAEKAENRVSQAEKSSTDNMQAAANGRALAAAVKARVSSRGTGQGVERVSAFEKSGVYEDDLLAMATKLFPD
jgi:hypothetical protein